jgi:hypothetical protein
MGNDPCGKGGASMSQFKADGILRELKKFQLATVEYAFKQLFDPAGSNRFLVADEVGLGKTLVARGIMAKAIERLQRDGVKRIDIIYVCSNSEIARQNIRKLQITDDGVTLTGRLAMLARDVRSLGPINIIALTPGTSLSRTAGAGIKDERVLLYWMLQQVWAIGTGTGPMNVLQATARDVRAFRAALKAFDKDAVDQTIMNRFEYRLTSEDRGQAKAGGQTLRERFDELCEEFRYARKHIPDEQNRRRNQLISELRGIMSAAGIDALKPGLVILDEFQRFRHLLGDDPESEAAALAQTLFRWSRPKTGEQARVLLLSATPYRGLTVAGDGGDDDHHEDFLATIRFLADSKEAADELRGILRSYRAALFAATEESPEQLRQIAGEIRRHVVRYMARTERIGVGGRFNAMLAEPPKACRLHPYDVGHYLLAEDLAGILEEPDTTELWKSTPYLLNFLDGYKFRERLDEANADVRGRRELAETVKPARELLLDKEAIAAFREIEPGNPRLRKLIEDVVDGDAWRMLWVPPALPYHQLGGAYGQIGPGGFTKRLVFSSWQAVPKSVAGLLSYIVDRKLTLQADRDAVNTPERRASQRNRLNFSVDQGRPAGMPALSLVYPSVALAAAADPREFARDHAGGGVAELRRWAQERVEPLLERLPQPAGERTTVDERWYWAAPVLVDQEHPEWWDEPALEEAWSQAPAADSGWRAHVELARATACGALDPPLGRRPRDLLAVTALYALGGPATLALRSLARVTGLPLGAMSLRLPAAQVGWALRGLFNSPEATALLRAENPETFWRQVLHHCIDGDLQAVLDEHAHMLMEQEGFSHHPAEDAAAGVADSMWRALRLRSSSSRYTSIEVDERQLKLSTQRLYTAYASRFADEEGESDAANEDGPVRATQLREAFNSPYWPFVLVSTSIGQEGLDFHPYCHAVVHWNLPTNPVDLEQREGRVHRYKGHAIRKNVAQAHGKSALASDAADPWAEAFKLAACDQQADDSGLVPFWVYEVDGGATVERHIFVLPFSREIERLERLLNGLAIYRLVFGQVRQEDLIDHLLVKFGPERAKALAAELRVDLRPPAL